MALSLVFAALFSALLHAGWNAAVKAAARPAETMTAQMLLGAAMVMPALFWSGLPAMASWPWVLASTLTNTLTVTALLRAYALGGFGVVYPVVRAMSVLLVVPLAAFLAGDRLGMGALAGIFLIVASLGLLGLSAGQDASFPPAAMLWTAIAGLSTAIYVLCDAQGVRASGSAMAYGFVVSIGNAIAMSWRLRKTGSPLRIMRDNWRIGAPAALASMASYLLILWVWTQTAIAPAAALRDTSAVFAILIAAVWLRERFTVPRLIAVALAAISVPLLRLG